MSPEKYAEIAADCERAGTGPLEYSYDDVLDCLEACEAYELDEPFWETDRGFRLALVREWLKRCGATIPHYMGSDDYE